MIEIRRFLPVASQFPNQFDASGRRDVLEIDLRGEGRKLDNRQDATVNVGTDVLVECAFGFPSLTKQDCLLRTFLIKDPAGDATRMNLGWPLDRPQDFKRFGPLI